jgi:uncharacterized protein
MAEISAEIKDKLLKFALELEKSNITIDKLYLYGSYATGKNHLLSDIDIAVISDNFNGERYIDYDYFIDAILKVDRLIEPIPFRPEDFTEDNPFVKEILEHGIRII